MLLTFLRCTFKLKTPLFVLSSILRTAYLNANSRIDQPRGFRDNEADSTILLVTITCAAASCALCLCILVLVVCSWYARARTSICYGII